LFDLRTGAATKKEGPLLDNESQEQKWKREKERLAQKDRSGQN
jgi:hypothetical protein